MRARRAAAPELTPASRLRSFSLPVRARFVGYRSTRAVQCGPAPMGLGSTAQDHTRNEDAFQNLRAQAAFNIAHRSRRPIA